MDGLADTIDENYERINGEEVMLSAASILHIGIQRNLVNIIYNFLKGQKCKVFAEAKVVFDDKNWFQPDLIVVCDRDKIRETHIEGPPDFVAEVLSPATQLRDFGIKKDTYERFGVQEYWIINPKDETVTVYLLENGKYRIDNVYHNYTEDEWRWLTEQEKGRQSLTLKLSLYDDLEMDVKEIFEE